MTSLRRARGFTLIEVVVAFAILALSLGALYESFGGALRRSAAGRDADLGIEWRIEAKPYPAELSEQSPWSAKAVMVEVTWKERHPGVVLQSVELVPRVMP
jgi:general secretion pathway protein I